MIERDRNYTAGTREANSEASERRFSHRKKCSN